MTTNERDSRGYCESLAHYVAALLERREFGNVIRQYDLNRDLLDQVGGSAAAIVLHGIAKAYAAQHDHQAALRTARKAQAMAADDGDSLLLAEIFVSLGNTLRDLGELREAEKAYRDAESIFRRNDHLEGQSRALNGLAGLFFRRNDYNNALSTLLEAIEIARTLGDHKKLAFMMGNIGRIYTFIGEMSQAEKHLRLNIELSSENGDDLEVAKAYLSLGYIFLQQAEYSKAEDAFDTAHRLIITTHSRRDEVIYLTYLGELQYRTGQLEASQASLERALVMAEEIAPDTTLVGGVLRHRAELAVRIGNFRLAQRIVHKALSIFEKSGDKVETGALWKLRGRILEAEEKRVESIAAYKQALHLLAESGVRFEKAEALIAAGSSKLFSARDRMTYLFRAEEYFSRSQMPLRQDEVSRLIGELEVDSVTHSVGSALLSAPNGDAEYVTVNSKIRQFLEQLPALARSDLPLLITGETGVGKDQLARYYHSVVRPGKPYVAINCASLPETLLESELFGYRKGAFTGAESNKLGLFVAANGGVLLLDEIGDLPLSLQAKLLGVLEKRKLTPLGSTTEVDLDIRLVAATNRNLEEMVARGTFRTDLYYRLGGIQFNLPPLRERKEDIPVLLERFMTRRRMLSEGERLPVELVRQFIDYSWPGNIRELDNTVKRLEMMAHMVAEGDLVELARSIFGVEEPASKGTLFDRVLEFERRLILEALQLAHGNKCEAARMLGVHEATVRTKLKRYGITSGAGAPS